jgi:hypothetical protein
MKLSVLLAKLRAQPEIEIEERTLPDGTRIYIPHCELPVPVMGHRWYVLVTQPDQTEVPRPEVEGLLRHLWQFQLDDEETEDDETPSKES